MLHVLSGISSLLISTLPVHSSAFKKKLLPSFVANTGSCVSPQNKIGKLLDASSRVECPRNINRLKNMTCGRMMTCEIIFNLSYGEFCVQP